MPRLRTYIFVAVSILAVVLGAWLVTGRASATGNAAPAGQTTTSDHALSVTGHGEVDVPPDMASLSLGVQVKGSTAQEALTKASTQLTGVISAIEGQGVPASHIQTSDLSIYYDQQQDTYVASHELSVRLDDVNKVGPALDAAVAAGANNSWGVNFGLKNPTAAKSQALQAAIADARTQADAMAAKLQVNITGISSASDTATYTPPIRYGGVAAAPAPASGTPVQAGQLAVTADANVAYTFTPQ